ncbi:MAG: hypothetical protein ACT4PO_10210 [Actinomycetota bacterium]
MRTRRFLEISLAAPALVFIACGSSASDRASTTPSGSSIVTAVTGTPTTPVEPPPPPATPLTTAGPPLPTCVNGWRTPPEGTPLRDQPVGIVRRTTGVEGPLVVTDMRYFEGPESPPSDKGYLLVVRRWYVKLYAADDPAFQGRFIVEARRFGRGLSAVAPYPSIGFHSPDWIGFQYESADPEPKAYAGLPGEWSGIPYDFVDGGEGLGIPGLPADVAGCLDGT